MHVGLRIFAMLLPLIAVACDRGAIESSAPPAPDPNPATQSFHLESLYMSTSIRLAQDAPPARTVSMTLSRQSANEMMGTLVIDPNTCRLDDFGDRRGCTRIAVRGIDVELRRVRVADPAHTGRRLFAMTGDGVPRGMTLIVQGDFREGELERCYLKLGSALVPLFLDDGM